MVPCVQEVGFVRDLLGTGKRCPVILMNIRVCQHLDGQTICYSQIQLESQICCAVAQSTWEIEVLSRDELASGHRALSRMCCAVGKLEGMPSEENMK